LIDRNGNVRTNKMFEPTEPSYPTYQPKLGGLFKECYTL